MSTAEALHNLHCPGVVKIQFLCSHEASSFNLHGTCSQICTLVAIVTSRARISVTDAINQWSNPRMLQAWGRQAVCALANLHQNCLIHQNIHPGAICLDDGGRVVLDSSSCWTHVKDTAAIHMVDQTTERFPEISLHRRFYNHIAQSPQKRMSGPLAVAFISGLPVLCHLCIPNPSPPYLRKYPGDSSGPCILPSA